MKRNEIDRVFTEKVQELMSLGYMINTNSMSGSQGEISKVDLVKGDELIRVWLINDYSRNIFNENVWYGNALVLRVGKWNKPASACRDSWDTVWMKDLDILSETHYYGIGKNWYSEDLDEAMRFQNIKYSRMSHSERNRILKEYITDNSLEIAVRYLQRKVGYKRINRSNISVQKVTHFSENDVSYYIEYNGNTYKLR